MEGKFNPDRQIAIIWSIDDVQEIRHDLTDDQAMKVLRTIEENYDAGSGITWGTLERYSKKLFPPKATYKIVNSEELAKFMLENAEIDKEYSLAADYPEDIEDTENWMSCEDWYDIIRTRIFDTDSIIIGYSGGGEKWIFDIEISTEHLADELAKYMRNLVNPVNAMVLEIK